MIALLAATAFAQDSAEGDRAWAPDTGGGCAAIVVTETTPAANATNVPVDVRPSLVFDGQCGSFTYVIDVTNPATAEVLASTTWTATTMPAIATLTPDAPLPFDTDLVLSATATDGYGTLAYVPFHTAAEVLPPLDGVLVVDVLEASYVAGDVADQLTATVRVTPITDPAALSLVQITGADGTVWRTPDELAEPQTFTWLGTATEQVCFEALQLDGRGGEIGPARDCASLDLTEPTGCGCDGTSGAPVGLGALVALLLARRARR